MLPSDERVLDENPGLTSDDDRVSPTNITTHRSVRHYMKSLALSKDKRDFSQLNHSTFPVPSPQSGSQLAVQNQDGT